MRFAQEISIFNPFAIEKAVIGLDTSITQTARKIELQATEIAVINGKVETNTASLSVMAGEISAEVKARSDADGALSSQIKALPGTITLKVDGTASKNTGASITLTVKDGNGKQISQSSGTVKIDGNVIFSNELYNAGTTTISGSKIHGGTLKLGGNNNENGQLYVYNASGAEIGHWTKDGIYIKNGEIYQEKYVDSTVKNAWLRIQSTEITGGYTGLGHTASVDLQDWQYYTDATTGQQTKIGFLALNCTNGGIRLGSDKVMNLTAKGEMDIYSSVGIVMAHVDLTTQAIKTGLAVADPGMVLIPGGENKLMVQYDGLTYAGSTKLNTRFADDSSGARRYCHLVNGLVCGLGY